MLRRSIDQARHPFRLQFICYGLVLGGKQQRLLVAANL
jgi:hypothetical protein